jgi:hypothetical protein
VDDPVDYYARRVSASFGRFQSVVSNDTFSGPYGAIGEVPDGEQVVNKAITPSTDGSCGL